jgi:hypothetical protein
MPYVKPNMISFDSNMVGREPSEFKKPRKVRRCKCCNTVLSIRNLDNLCWPCDKAIQEWKNFPWKRAELEREMAKHCLDYVEEHCAKKKKGCDESREEVSSGSFARAIGRKTIERK